VVEVEVDKVPVACGICALSDAFSSISWATCASSSRMRSDLRLREAAADCRFRIFLSSSFRARSMPAPPRDLGLITRVAPCSVRTDDWPSSESLSSSDEDGSTYRF